MRCRQPAFLARAGARTGLSAFLEASLDASLGAAALAAASLPPLPEIGSSISRWPSTRFFGFLPLAVLTAVLTAGAASFSLAMLFFSASIRLMTLPPVFGAAFAAIGAPERFLLMRSISAVS